jgi:hypothetical protein
LDIYISSFHQLIEGFRNLLKEERKMRRKQLRRVFVLVIAILTLVMSACDSPTGQVDSSANTVDTASEAQPDLAETIAANQTAIAQTGATQEVVGDSGGDQIATDTQTAPIPTETAPIETVDPGDGSGDEWSSQDINDLLATIFMASKLEPLTPINEVEDLEPSEDGQYRYIKEKHNVIENKESVLYLGQNDAVLYPGAIIEGKDVYDFVYSPVITSRTPITLSLSLEGVTTTGSALKKTVDDPSVLSNVRQGVNDLLKGAITPNTIVPARFSYENSQVYSSEERNLSLGVSGSYANVTVDYDFDWSTESKKNRIMSIYKQVYYTVDVDMPQNPYDFFDPSIGVDGLAAALPPGSMPLYVSSVSYGWMAVLFIETDFSKDEVDMALGVAYDDETFSTELDFGYTVQEVFDSSKIYIVVYGGSTVGITSSTLTGLSGLMELISASKNFGSDSPGIPISYTLRHLSDNLIAKIALTEEYTITRPVKLREFVKISVDKFFCGYADDGSGNLDMDRIWAWVNLYRGADHLLKDVYLVAYSHEEDGQQWGYNSVWSPPNAQTVMMLDLERTPISSYNITLSSYVRDWDECDEDSWCANPSEAARNSVTINGNMIYKSMDPLQLYNEGDFDIYMFYTIEPATYQEYCTYDSSPSFCP